MTFKACFPAVKPLPGSKREFPKVLARVNTGIKRGNGAQSPNPVISVDQSVPIAGRPGTKTLDEFVRKPFRASPVPATTYEHPTALGAQRPLSRTSARQGVANVKLESDKVSTFRAKPVPASTYKQPKGYHQLFKTKKTKEDTHPVAIPTTTENQNLPVVVKPDLPIDVVVEELPPAPSLARNDQDPVVTTEPETDISTKDKTCLEDEDEDDDCWDMMGDWISQL